MDMNNLSEDMLKALALSESLNPTKIDLEEAIIGRLKHRPAVDEGTHLTVITNAEVETKETKYGEKDCVTLDFKVIENGKTLKKNLWYNEKLDSEYVTTLYELLNKNPLDGFRKSELKGIICSVEVIHNESNGNVYPNVAGITKVQVPTGTVTI